MQAIIEGVYRNGKIELSEIPSHVCEGTCTVIGWSAAKYFAPSRINTKRV